MKDLYYENLKTLIKEIEDNRSEWKDITYHGLDELILSKCPHYQIARFNATLLKMPIAFFTELKKNTKICK